ncbi:N-alpha-acetyltransferase 40 [Taenia crassiceps]|uniref:N-alpha-acetyltransferase 40 n=1 Tax=Taenia crassiceps TaxID=6207 RepID=A0ABR4QLF5_9CEST
MPLAGGSWCRRPILRAGCAGDSRVVVLSAKQLSSSELISRFGADSYCFCSTELTANHKARVFSILEKNMKGLYMKSSWGWNGDSKLDELFDRDSRLLLCFLTKVKTCCDSGLHVTPPSLPASLDEPCAFVNFRFEVDTRRPVLYCYEIQLLEEVRGLRLGRGLLHILYKIAADNQMARVVLTVFRFNSSAYAFFTRNGFTTDTSDPSRYGQPADYCILSRPP